MSDVYVDLRRRYHHRIFTFRQKRQPNRSFRQKRQPLMLDALAQRLHAYRYGGESHQREEEPIGCLASGAMKEPLAFWRLRSQPSWA